MEHNVHAFRCRNARLSLAKRCVARQKDNHDGRHKTSHCRNSAPSFPCCKSALCSTPQKGVCLGEGFFSTRECPKEFSEVITSIWESVKSSKPEWFSQFRGKVTVVVGYAHRCVVNHLTVHRNGIQDLIRFLDCECPRRLKITRICVQHAQSHWALCNKHVRAVCAEHTCTHQKAARSMHILYKRCMISNRSLNFSILHFNPLHQSFIFNPKLPITNGTKGLLWILIRFRTRYAHCAWLEPPGHPKKALLHFSDHVF